MRTLDRDAAGFPIMLSGESETPGNSAPSVAATEPVSPSTRPSTVDHVEWARRWDAVREAAREFEVLSEQDLKERLRGVTTKPLEDGDLIQFKADVRAAVLDDLIDVLDQTVRGKLRGRRTVRVNAPRNYVKKTMKALTPEEVTQLESRLRSRGWTDKQVKESLHEKHGVGGPQPTRPDPGTRSSQP